MRARSIAVQMVLPLLAVLTIAGCDATSGPDSPGTTTAPTPGVASSPGSAGPGSAGPVSAGPASTDEAPGATVAELEAVINQVGGAKPYSAQLKLRSLVGGQVAVVMSGRLNFNGPLAGRLKLRTAALDGERPMAVEELIVNNTVFVRQQKQGARPAGQWRRVPTAAAGSAPLTDPARYAKLLLALGPRAVKGQETRGGVAAARLSGVIKTEQIRKVEPSLYGRLRTADVQKFTCDIWIDGAGRTIRLEQWIRIRGVDAHNIMTISKFRRPVTVKRPI